jgi:RimJ/RimL family protein N-acetyltransferase
MDPQPTTLIGRHVRLEPLELGHATDLFAALMADPSIWRLRPVVTPATVEELRSQISDDLEAQTGGSIVAFAQIALASGRAVGSTTYMNISRRDSGLEIGSTWLGRRWQRTGINTEAKYLLLRHAFEDLGAVRVELRTDLRNLQSQAAIERLGAVREGVLRKYRRLPDGFIRDTVVYSILDTEWAAVKAGLQAKMASH